MFVIVEIFRYRKGGGWMEREKRKKGTPDQTLDIDTLYYFAWVAMYSAAHLSTDKGNTSIYGICKVKLQNMGGHAVSVIIYSIQGEVSRQYIK